jgi:hypothetical protein
VPDEQLFGHALKLTNSDLDLEQGQLVEISGRDNLLQALALRVLTPFGSDAFNTSYGLDITSAFTEPHREAGHQAQSRPHPGN